MKKHILPPFPLLMASLAGGLPAVSAQAPAIPPPAPVPVMAAVLPPAAPESPPVLRASQFLAPGLAAGPVHRVREAVPTDGYLAHYTVDTDFGTFEAAGTTQLRRLVREIEAIARLNAVSRSDVFAYGLRRSLEQPVTAARNVVTRPVDTVKALPGTVGHLFKKIGNGISTTAGRIRERAAGDGAGEGGGASAARGMAKAGRGFLGFDKARLECARQLGVDPYTDNARLQEAMEKVAWVFWSGGLPLRVGGMVTGAGTVIDITRLAGLPGEVYEVTPDELLLRHNTAMEALRVPPEARRAFNTSPALTLSLRHSILTSVAALDGAGGRAALVGLAADCEDTQQARFLDEILRILARRQAEGAPAVRAIRLMGRIPAAVDAAGALVMALPVDYVSWTAEVSEFVNSGDFADLKPRVHHTGGVSPLAAQELARAGWILHRL